jgi:hypothetical protein
LYSEVTVSILLSLNVFLQDSNFFRPVINTWQPIINNIITYNLSRYKQLLSEPLWHFSLRKLFQCIKGAIQQVDFTAFLNWLKLSSFFIFRGSHLYNLTPKCSTLFWSKDVLQNCVWRSYLLLVLYLWNSQLCWKSTLSFLYSTRLYLFYSMLLHKQHQTDSSICVIQNLQYAFKISYNRIVITTIVEIITYIQ